MSGRQDWCIIPRVSLSIADTVVNLTYRCTLVQCGVTDWDQQVKLFEKAKALSSTGRVHYVVANAGVTGYDDLFAFEAKSIPPLITYIQTLLQFVVATNK